MDSDMPEAMFRAPKRRKILRTRLREEEDAEITGVPNASYAIQSPRQEEATLPHSSTAVDATNDAEEEYSVADILRRRKAGKQRRAGIEFTNTKAQVQSSSAASQSASLVLVDSGKDALEVASSRFTAQTGQVADVMDKHMMSYIDAKMAKLRESSNSAQASASDSRGEDLTPAGLLRTRQPAGVGKLLEIDLGPDTTLQNIARTEAAQRRLETGEPDAAPAGPAKKPRLGKDGKPWRPRKRRNSEDLKRDKLVEDILRESRLDIYEEPATPDPVDDDQAADDRMAEQFRREFLDQVASKNVRKPAPAPPGPGGKAEGPKGPKMGGSRSARAAMRLQEEQAAKKKR